jgi:hypothetical protein
LAYRGSHDLLGPWKWGQDSTAHQRLVQGNANYWKDTLATKLALRFPVPVTSIFRRTRRLGLMRNFSFNFSVNEGKNGNGWA